jgi:hypothetical protein
MEEQSPIDQLLDRQDLHGIEGSNESNSMSQTIQSKRKLLESLNQQILTMKDDLQLNQGKVPKYHLHPHKELIKDEEMEYANATNKLVEI